MTLSNAARLAKNLRVARRSANVSQETAAKAVGKTRQTIINWENPAMVGAEPSTTELDVLAKVYGIDAQDLRFGTLREPQRAVVEAKTPSIPEGVTLEPHPKSEDAQPTGDAHHLPKDRAGGDR